MHIKFYCPTFKSIGPTPKKNNRSPHLAAISSLSADGFCEPHISLAEGKVEAGVAFHFPTRSSLSTCSVPRIHQGRPDVTLPTAQPRAQIKGIRLKWHEERDDTRQVLTRWTISSSSSSSTTSEVLRDKSISSFMMIWTRTSINMLTASHELHPTYLREQIAEWATPARQVLSESPCVKGDNASSFRTTATTGLVWSSQVVNLGSAGSAER